MISEYFSCIVTLPLDAATAAWVDTFNNIIRSDRGDELPRDLQDAAKALGDQLEGVFNIQDNHLNLVLASGNNQAFDAVLTVLGKVINMHGMSSQAPEWILEYSIERLDETGTPVGYGGGALRLHENGYTHWKTEHFVAGAMSDLDEALGSPQLQD